MNGLADRRRLSVLAIAQRADDDLAGVDADAETDRLLQLVDQGAVHFGQVPVDQASRFQGLTTGYVGLGVAAEGRHHAVADELVGRAAGRDDRAPDRLEEPVQDEDDIVGQAVLDELGRSADIDKEDRDKAFRPGFSRVEAIRVAHGVSGGSSGQTLVSAVDLSWQASRTARSRDAGTPAGIEDAEPFRDTHRAVIGVDDPDRPAAPFYKRRTPRAPRTRTSAPA